MRTFILTLGAVALLFLFLSTIAESHSEGYRGPRGVVPPNGRTPQDPIAPPNQGGPPGTTPRPDPGPSEPPPGGGRGGTTPPNPKAGPNRPNPAADGGRGSTIRGGVTPSPGRSRGQTKAEGFERWEFYWEHNREHFLQRRARIHNAQTWSGSAAYFLGNGPKNEALTTFSPTRNQVKTIVVPALRRLLAHGHYEIRSSASIALGKTGGKEEVEILIKLLRDSNEQVRESAALALGILGESEAIPFLVHIMKDDRKGRMLSKLNKVRAPTRAFAALSLGLIGHSSVIEPLLSAIDEKERRADVPICAITALGIMKATSAVPTLLEILENKKLDVLVRAHAANALGRIGDKSAVPALLKTIRVKNWHIRNSTVIALGLLTEEGDPQYNRVVSSLVNTAKKGSTPQEKNWACIALGQIGGKRARTHLLETLGRGSHSLKAFAALALAVFGMEKERDETILKELRKEFLKAKSSSEKGAFALSLGLLKDKESAKMIKAEALGRGDPSTRGYAALALGLLNHRESIPDLQKIIFHEQTQNDLLRQASLGLGLMGSKTAVPLLLKILDEASSLYLRGSITLALGYIGDREAIKPLVEIAQSDRAQVFSRSFASIALGIICEENDPPVLSEIARNINYRALVESLRKALFML